jgi:probable DNA metabolism protein
MEGSFERWRARVRPMLASGIKAEAMRWPDGEAIAPQGAVAASKVRQVRLPAPLMRLLDSISCFRTPGRFELMYRLAWRTLYENPRLLEDAADSDVRSATSMDSAVRRDCHKMHAFVRFREFLDENGERAYFSWFEPEHLILSKGAEFFVKRFPNMNWTIATPDGAIVWNGTQLTLVEAIGIAQQPPRDAHEDLWRTYYRNICNVARINPPAMQREMPQKYWRNLPEAQDIGVLIRDGLATFEQQQAQSDERKVVMSKAIDKALELLPDAGEGPEACRRCELWKHATQAVVGEGPDKARVMLVGEQPGDEEDLRGHPFVGPAGRLLDTIIVAAGIEREDVFITNAVKHFKWEPRGKRRLHKKPDLREINACNVWLEREIQQVKPALIVALGATALRALLGRTVSIDAARRQELTYRDGTRVIATYHPSAILRSEGERATELHDALLQDLKLAADTSAT